MKSKVKISSAERRLPPVLPVQCLSSGPFRPAFNPASGSMGQPWNLSQLIGLYPMIDER